MELVQQYSPFFYGILSVLAVMLVFCLVRAVKGPRIADRLVAVNMMGTMVMVMIALLAVVKDQGYLVDICLIYAMISFLSVVVLTRIYTGVYRDAQAVGAYYKELAQGVCEEVRILEKLAGQRGFVPYQNCQMEEMEDGIGYEMLLYRRK